MDYTDKQRVVLPHGENAVAVPVYDIGYKIGPNGECLPGDPIGHSICRDDSPQHADVGFVVGTDVFHTPERLTEELVLRFSAEGLSVAINRPFSGALVPMRYFRNNDRVTSVMVEVNRRLYLDEVTGKTGAHFGRIQSVLAKVLGALTGHILGFCTYRRT